MVKKHNRKLITHTVLASVLFLISFWGVTYTADWFSYEAAFDEGLLQVKNDWAYGYLGALLRHWGYNNFIYLYRTHIFLMAVLFPLLFYKIKVSPLLLTAVTIVFLYVAIANQIRYYLAFPIALFALYYIFVEENRLVALILAIIAVLSHSGIAVFLLVQVFFYYYMGKRENVVKILLYSSIGLFALYSFFSDEIISRLGVFDYYLTSANQHSSLVGGIYNLLPSIISISFVIYMHSYLQKNDKTMTQNRKYKFLFIVGIATVVLSLMALRTQIIAHRYINPLICIWIGFFIYTKKTSFSQIKKRANLFISVILVMELLWATIVPYYLGIYDTLLNPEMVLIISSIQF